MKLLSVIIASLLLSACATPVPVPVPPPRLPEMPSALSEPCEDLKPIEKRPADQPYTITDILKPTIENYRRAIECKVKHQSTVEWYQETRGVFNGVK